MALPALQPPVLAERGRKTFSNLFWFFSGAVRTESQFFVLWIWPCYKIFPLSTTLKTLIQLRKKISCILQHFFSNWQRNLGEDLATVWIWSATLSGQCFCKCSACGGKNSVILYAGVHCPYSSAESRPSKVKEDFEKSVIINLIVKVIMWKAMPVRC